MGIVLSGFLFMAAGCGGGSDGIPGGVNFIPSARVCSLDMPISGKELTDNISWSGSDGCAFGSGPNNSYIATFGGLSAEWIIAITVNNIAQVILVPVNQRLYEFVIRLITVCGKQQQRDVP